MKTENDQLETLGDLMRAYWNIYGGIRDILKSGFFKVAVIIWLVSFSTWANPLWWDLVIQILPNLLGFTLGGYALSLTIGNDIFRGVIVDAKDKKGHSVLLKTSATFVHFVITQLLALLIALVAKSFFFRIGSLSESAKLLFDRPILVSAVKAGSLMLWGAGYLIFIYALCVSGAACLAIFRLSYYLNDFQNAENEDKA